MPVPLFICLADFLSPLVENVDEIWQCVGNLPEDLMKKRPEEAERSLLEDITATVEEEREDKVAAPNAEQSVAIAESMF